MAVAGEAIDKGHDAQNLTMGKIFTAHKYERVYLQAMSISTQAE